MIRIATPRNGATDRERAADLTRLLRASATAACLLSVMAGCLPSTPFAPIAVREQPGGAVEILYRPCDPARVRSVEVVAPNDKVYDESDPRIWKITLEL